MERKRRLGPETQAILEALAKLAPGEYPEVQRVGIWTFVRWAREYYRVVVEENYIAMTGGDVAVDLRFPFPFRWLRTDFYHTDAALAASTDPLAIQLNRPVDTMEPLGDFTEILLFKRAVRDAMYGENWGENFEYEPSVWNLIMNSTNTDLIFPIFYVRRLTE